MPECPKCASLSCIKWGKRHNKHRTVQRYGCASCGNKFAIDKDSMFKSRANKPAVMAAIDLSKRGLSTRDIAEHITRCHGVRITHASVSRWIKNIRFIDMYYKIGEDVPKWQQAEQEVEVEVPLP